MARTNERMAIRIQRNFQKQMTVGALIFAFDSEIKYTKLAIECANTHKKIFRYTSESSDRY